MVVVFIFQQQCNDGNGELSFYFDVLTKKRRNLRI